MLGVAFPRDKAKLQVAEPKVRARAPAQAVTYIGGNLPFYRRLPFMRGQGFTPRHQVVYNEVNLDQLTEAFKASEEVSPETLEKAHLLRDSRNPTVILGRGEINVALKVRAHRVSVGAKEKIEKAGGSVELIG